MNGKYHADPSREILSTLEMLQSEHLDVRTVTLGINLMDCTSVTIQPKNCAATLPQDQNPGIQPGADLHRVGDKYGIPVVNKRISVSPDRDGGRPLSAPQMVKVARPSTMWPPRSMWISSAVIPPWSKKVWPAATGR
jgi:uncharacterized protein (UPF0210 family)